MRVARLLLAALALWIAVRPATAEEVVAALSRSEVAITTRFEGSEILIFGAVKRDAPAPADARLDVVVVLIGPSTPVVVRKKERRFGIWVNDGGVTVDAAPSLYAVASSGPFSDIVSHTENLRHRIGLDHAVRLIGETQAERYPEDYRQALIRIRRNAGVYYEAPDGVQIERDTLFSTSIALPAQLVEGDYLVRIFLLRDKAVVDQTEQTISVRKEGFERWIYNAAKSHSALYGIGALAVALLAGWLASAFFRVFFP